MAESEGWQIAPLLDKLAFTPESAAGEPSCALDCIEVRAKWR